MTFVIFSGVLPAALVALVWPRRAAQGVGAFIFLAAATVLWSLIKLADNTATTLDEKVFWENLQFTALTAAASAWTVFTLQAAGHSRYTRRSHLIFLAGAGLLFNLMIWTDNWHHLYRVSTTLDISSGLPLLDSTYAFGFWTFLSFIFLLLAAGAALLVRAKLQSKFVEQVTALVLFNAAFVPVFSILFFIPAINPFPFLGLQVFFFSISVLLFGWAIVQQNLLDHIPAAKDSLLENVPAGILILDPDNRLLEINQTAIRIMKIATDNPVRRLLSEVIPEENNFTRQLEQVTEDSPEIMVQFGEEVRYFDIRVRLQARTERGASRLVVIRDITDQKKTEVQLREQTHLLENLVTIARSSNIRTDLQGTLTSILSTTSRITGAQVGSLILLDPQGRVTHNVFARGDTPAEIEAHLLPILLNSGLAGWAVRNKKAAIVADVEKDERWYANPDQPYPVRAALVVPIGHVDAIQGVLTLEHEEPGHFSEEHATLLQAAADQMALALKNAQVHEEQQQINRRQVMLYKVLRTVSGHLDPETILQVALNAVAAETEIPAISVWMPVLDKEQLQVKASIGKLQYPIDTVRNINGTISGETFTSGKSRYIEIGADSGEEYDDTTGIRSELAVPLLSGQKTLGILSFGQDNQNAFDIEDILLAELIADAIALALENARLYTQTQRRLGEQILLRKAAEMIASSLDLSNGLETIGEQLTSSLDLAGVFHYSLDTPNRSALLLASHTPDAARWKGYETLKGGGPIPLDQNFVDRLHSGKVLTVNINDPIFEKIMRDAMETAGIKTVFITPFSIRGHLVGFAELFDQNENRRLLKEEEELIQAISQQAAFALQRAQLFEDIQRSRQAAEEADLAKTEFITFLAHELHGPMTSIKGFSEMLSVGSMGPINDAQLNFLKIIQSTVDRMVLLVSDLTDISKIESGNLNLKLTEVDAQVSISEVVSELQNKISQNNQQVQTLVSEGLPKVIADPNRLTQIIHNLVSNAVKYTPQGGRIFVSARLHENKSKFIQITVADTGIGISQEDQEHVFEKFFRTKDELARDINGTGLGLNISRHLIELQGGKIWFESQLRKGSTFHFTLPISPEKEV